MLEEKENIYFEGQIEDDISNVNVVRYENEKNIQLKVKVKLKSTCHIHVSDTLNCEKE